jgi:hypothetical protein
VSLPQGMLRTREVMEKLKAVAPAPGQKAPILVYLGLLLQKGRLNAYESSELARWGGGGGCWSDAFLQCPAAVVAGSMPGGVVLADGRYAVLCRASVVPFCDISPPSL